MQHFAQLSPSMITYGDSHVNHFQRLTLTINSTNHIIKLEKKNFGR